MARHLRFIGRTVMVQGGDVEAAYKILNRVLTQEGILETVRRRRYYEKPFQERNRKHFEKCKQIYNSEMTRKMKLISRTNREDPWFGC